VDKTADPDEIAVLDAAFRQMQNRLGEQWRSLTRQDQERRELVANISHDLRTPLASLHGYLETLSLKDATLSPEERRRYLGIALDQSRKGRRSGAIAAGTGASGTRIRATGAGAVFPDRSGAGHLPEIRTHR
jgi:signal transduction histidine kinase